MESDKNELPKWEVKETSDVLSDLDTYTKYILNVKKNEQAADAVLIDYDETLEELKKVAGSLGFMKKPRFAEKGYRQIFFRRHDYYLVYKMMGDVAVVYQMVHVLQDQDKSIR